MTKGAGLLVMTLIDIAMTEFFLVKKESPIKEMGLPVCSVISNGVYILLHDEFQNNLISLRFVFQEVDTF